MTVIAKPIVDKKFWILTENDVKVGNVEADNTGYQIKINNQVTHVKSIKNIEKIIDVTFQPAIGVKHRKDTVHGYPAGKNIHNAVWDLTQNLPLFTKTKRSKCWFAAGWYKVTREDATSSIYCPKLIILRRYPYEGPFYQET
jgi:hypothetical protein